MLDELLETTWNICKQYDILWHKRDKIRLINYVSYNLEITYNEETENLYRKEWLNEVNIFCLKYGYN